MLLNRMHGANVWESGLALDSVKMWRPRGLERKEGRERERERKRC
jgi:hypothetical protein